MIRTFGKTYQFSPNVTSLIVPPRISRSSRFTCEKRAATSHPPQARAFQSNGAFGLTRFLRSVLYETQPTELTTFLGMGLLLSLVGVLASCVPAFRAAQVDPVQALRAE